MTAPERPGRPTPVAGRAEPDDKNDYFPYRYGANRDGEFPIAPRPASGRWHDRSGDALYLVYPDAAALPAIAGAIGRAYLPDLDAAGTLRRLRRR